MKVKLIIISIILLLVMVFACGCIPVMEKLGLVNPANEEQLSLEKGGPPDGLVKVLIGFKEKPGPPELALVKGLGGKIKYTYNLIPAIAASVPEVAIEALKKNPNITNVELDSMVYALDTELDDSWGVKRIGAGYVHDSTNKGTGVKVAIIDTGIDYTHTDLANNFDANVKGYDFVNSDSDPMDDNGHGTHVAGVVAAEDNDFGVVGVAPEAELYALKALDETGSGYVSDVVAAIMWATDPNNDGNTDDRMDVINMSFGGTYNSWLLDAACLLAYYQDELILVAAAGNSGNPGGGGDNVGYPAAYDSVIAVAATNQSDERASWSSTGPDVELAAPGVGIYSTYIGGYATLKGTSMASPHVAGVAALVWANPANSNWTNDEVRAQLQNTADDLGVAGWDSKYGYGLVDADEAAGVLPPPPNEPPIVSITSPADGSTFDFGVAIPFEGTAIDSEDGDLTVNLVWISSIDDQIGTGGSFSTILSDGTHTITAVVTDSGDETGSDSIGITVGTPSSNIMHVSDIYMSLKKAGINVNAIATVTIVDASDNPVEGATVSGTWSGATSDNDSGVTDTYGKVSLQSNKVKKPSSGTTFTFTVIDVTKSGWTYDPGANEETSDSTTYN